MLHWATMAALGRPLAPAPLCLWTRRRAAPSARSTRRDCTGSTQMAPSHSRWAGGWVGGVAWNAARRPVGGAERLHRPQLARGRECSRGTARAQPAPVPQEVEGMDAIQHAHPSSNIDDTATVLIRLSTCPCPLPLPVLGAGGAAGRAGHPGPNHPPGGRVRIACRRPPAAPSYCFLTCASVWQPMRLAA